MSRCITSAVFAALSTVAASAVVLSTAPRPAFAQLIPDYTVLGQNGEHVDIGVEYDAVNNALELNIHDETNGVEYETDEALLFLPDIDGVTRLTRPASSNFDFLGTAVGNDVLVIPASQTGTLLLLGIGNEELSGPLFSGPTTFNLVSVTGALGAARPGQFSVFNTDGMGNPIVTFATSDGIDGNDFLSIPLGSHRDLNWAFTNTGIYEVTLRAVTGLAAGGTLSDQRTYTFGIGTTIAPTITAAPEPGSVALLGIGLAGMTAMIARRRKAA